jgi:hypothetical protein
LWPIIAIAVVRGTPARLKLIKLEEALAHVVLELPASTPFGPFRTYGAKNAEMCVYWLYLLNT